MPHVLFLYIIASSPTFMLQPALQMGEVTVELKIFFDCEKCLRKVRDTIVKMDGVFFVNVDEKNNKVTVKGHNISGEKICRKLCSKLGIYAEVLPPPKTAPEKKDPPPKPEQKPETKKPEETKPKPKEESKGKDKPEGDVKICIINNFYCPHPTIFSDENPNAYCSVM